MYLKTPNLIKLFINQKHLIKALNQKSCENFQQVLEI